jgi:hypothetical protein
MWLQEETLHLPRQHAPTQMAQPRRYNYAPATLPPLLLHETSCKHAVQCHSNTRTTNNTLVSLLPFPATAVLPVLLLLLLLAAAPGWPWSSTLLPSAPDCRACTTAAASHTAFAAAWQSQPLLLHLLLLTLRQHSQLAAAAAAAVSLLLRPANMLLLPLSRQL